MAKNSETFWCDTCKGIEVGGLAKLKKHMMDVHAIDLSKVKGKCGWLSHIDGDTWFSTSYAITVKRVKLHQEVVCQRDKDDPILRLI